MAVDSGDHLWLTDRRIEEGRVNKYSSTGTWEAETASPPWDMAHMLESIAFDEAAEKVFVSDSNHDSLWGLDPADASYEGPELKPVGETPCCAIRVAADNSDGLYDGVLYVFSSTGRIVRIDSEGNPIDYTEGSSAGTNELSGADTPFGSFDGPVGLSGGGLAVDSVGHLWVADSPGSGGVLHEFSPTGKYLRTITHAGPQQLTEVTAVTVDPTTGNVLVSDIGFNKVREYTSSGAFVGDTATITGGPAVGLAVDSTGKLYVSGAGLPGDKHVDIFGPAGPPAAKHSLEIEVTGAGEVIGAGIACAEADNGTAACEEELVSGAEVPLSATPAAGYLFKGWTTVAGDAGGCTGTSASCETGALDEATKLEALFVPVQNLDVRVTGSGKVNSSPAGISECGAPAGACQASYAQGTVVTLTAEPAAGSTFAGWFGGGCSGTEACQVTLNADTEVTARFREVEPSPRQPRAHRLRVNLAGSGAGSVTDGTGAISCPSVCTHSYAAGTQVTLTPTAAPGSRFVGWAKGDCAGVGACQLTIGAETTLTARFAKSLPAPARLRISGVRARGARQGCPTVIALASTPLELSCPKVKIAVRGTIAKAASGLVRVRISTKLSGQRVTTSKRVRIRDGRWRARLALPWADHRSSAALEVAARFGGSTGVRSDNTKRRFKLRG